MLPWMQKLIEISIYSYRLLVLLPELFETLAINCTQWRQIIAAGIGSFEEKTNRTWEESDAVSAKGQPLTWTFPRASLTQNL